MTQYLLEELVMVTLEVVEAREGGMTDESVAQQLLLERHAEMQRLAEERRAQA